jgi:thiol-disulfide isomerase/thioredoxin
LTIHVTDQNQNPIEGANIGLGSIAGQRASELADEDRSGTEWYYYGNCRSDKHGHAVLKTERRLLDHFCIVGRHEKRKIIAINHVSDPSSPLTMRLVPEHEVSLDITSRELAKRDHKLGNVRLTVFQVGKASAVFDSLAQDARLVLPAGHYELDINAGWPAQRMKKVIEVLQTSDAQRLDTIDLLAARMFALEGEQAPDLADVVAWKNSVPLRLADLRGKCVILEFGGYWCGPCVRQLPILFSLFDKYQAKGLVIIWVHSDVARDDYIPVGDASALDDRLAGIRASAWNGRDIPFPVAITMSKEAPTPIAGDLPGFATNATYAAFGVHAVPDAVLIDRQGRVVKRFDPESDSDIAILRKTLGE